MIDVKRCMAHAWRQNEQTVFCCSHPWSFYKVSSLKEWKGNLFCKSFMWHKLPPHWHGTWSEIPQGFQKRSRDIPSLPEWIKKAAKQSKPETLHIIIKNYVCLRRKTENIFVFIAPFLCVISLSCWFQVDLCETRSLLRTSLTIMWLKVYLLKLTCQVCMFYIIQTVLDM